MPERTIYRIVFHTENEKKFFGRVKGIIELIVPSEMIRQFEPQDNGKKVIFFAATNVEKKKIEKQLEGENIKITISSPLAPC